MSAERHEQIRRALAARGRLAAQRDEQRHRAEQDLSAFEHPVRIGNDPLVHLLSAFYHNETRCGLGGVQAPDLSPTKETPTCPQCLRTKAA